jgi:hypothetical protein
LSWKNPKWFMVSGCAGFSSRNLTYDIVILTMFHVIVMVSGRRYVTTRYHLKHK